jgi:hypothetical protein
MNNNPGAALFARQALQYSTGVHITFFDGAGNHRVDLTLGESGPQLMLFDPGKICRTSLGVYPQGPSLSLSDKNGDTVECHEDKP